MDCRRLSSHVCVVAEVNERLLYLHARVAWEIGEVFAWAVMGGTGVNGLTCENHYKLVKCKL